MKKYFLIIVASLLLTRASGQEFSIVDAFAFIESSSDTSSLKFIQSITAYGTDITAIYELIKKKAKQDGANCFKLRKFIMDSSKKMTLILDTYYGDNNVLQVNHMNHEKNVVYIISDGNFSSENYTFKINGIKKRIKSGTYYKYIINKGEQVKINKGGFSGTTATFVWEEDKQPRFFTLSGFGLSDMPLRATPYPTSGTGFGIAFTSGKIKSVDTNFGLLITKILKQQR